MKSKIMLYGVRYKGGLGGVEYSWRLTTPHKLQAEACARKRASRRPGVYVPRKPMAEACQLHAVVRRQT